MWGAPSLLLCSPSLDCVCFWELVSSEKVLRVQPISLRERAEKLWSDLTNLAVKREGDGERIAFASL